MKTTLSFLLGISLGVISTVVVQRLIEEHEPSDPNALADRLAEQLESLEDETFRD
ncbi:MAG: hypothetical protein ACOYON_07100 [Fimbriimonas sp.]